MERLNIQGGIRRAYLGQAAAFTIGVTGLIVAGVVAVKGQPWVAGVISVADITGLVTAFLRGAESQKDERLARARILSGQEPEKRAG